MNLGQVLAFASAKNGVGKSTIILSLAHNLASLKKRICVVDMDLFLGELHISMNLEQFYDNKKTLYQLLKKEVSLDECLIFSNQNPNIAILPSCTSICMLDINLDRLSSVIDDLKTQFDYILLDIPSGLGTINFSNISYKNIDKLIFVASHNNLSITRTDNILDYFDLYYPNLPISLIITNYFDSLDKDDSNLSLNNIKSVLDIPILGFISHQSELLIDNYSDIHVNKKSKYYKEINLLTERIINSNFLSINSKKKNSMKAIFNHSFSKNKIKNI